MGHLLSKNGKRVKKRKRKLQRNCFLHGPCMLCFIVHSNANSSDENQLESASKLAERYATLSTPEDCAKFLLSPKELWEEQGKSLLSSVPAKFIGPQLFRTVSTEYSEMVCKRKCGGVQKCTPCKQPRCTFQEVTENGVVSDPAAQCHIHLCSLPSSSSSSTECSSVGLQVDLGESSTTTNQGSSESSELAPHKNLPELKVFETDVSSVNLLPSSILLKGCQVSIAGGSLLAIAWACLCAIARRCLPWRSFAADLRGFSGAVGVSLGALSWKAAGIATSSRSVAGVCHLTVSIAAHGPLKIFAHLSVKERCLSASLVCKYWCDLCLDFQFWKQIDLSGRQQVTDDLLVKIAARRQNVTEINISDCRNVLDDGVRSLASQCPGLLKYTAYRCKQLSDLSLLVISTHCPLLQKVHVGNQDKLTDEALKQVSSLKFT
ncbi:FXL17 protein, partial [Polyodon spathula]|nr:FXL17 protein [Polyodon spathula]